jgi:type II secretory pathway component PulF
MEMRKITSKRGQLGGLSGGVLTIVVVGILVAISMYILTSIGDNLTDNSAAQNATNDIVTQLTDFVPWLGIILLVLAAGIVLFFVIRSFSGKGV